MDDNAVLGPWILSLASTRRLDPQGGRAEAHPQKWTDQTLILADMSRKALGQVKKTVTDILGDRMECDRAAQMAEVLASGTWTHDYPISVGRAREIGLTVSTDVPQEIYQLMNLYPNGPAAPSVEYIPIPYLPRDERSGAPRASERCVTCGVSERRTPLLNVTHVESSQPVCVVHVDATRAYVLPGRWPGDRARPPRMPMDTSVLSDSPRWKQLAPLLPGQLMACSVRSPGLLRRVLQRPSGALLAQCLPTASLPR